MTGKPVDDVSSAVYRYVIAHHEREWARRHLHDATLAMTREEEAVWLELKRQRYRPEVWIELLDGSRWKLRALFEGIEVTRVDAQEAAA